MTDKNEYLKKFKRCINEYVSFEGVSEDGETVQDPMAAAPADPTAAAPADPTAAAPADPMAADPTAADPTAAAPAAPMAADPTATAPADQSGAAATPEQAAPGEANGFSPEGEDVNSMTDTQDNGDEDEEVIDVDELVDSQEKSEKKIDKLTNKFERLLGKLDSVEKMIDANNEKISHFEAEMERRNPTPEEKLSLRSKDAYPFTVSPTDYWKTKEETSNYSTADDNNGSDMPKYTITKSDIDNINDWQNISSSFDDDRERLGLRDILGY